MEMVGIARILFFNVPISFLIPACLFVLSLFVLSLFVLSLFVLSLFVLSLFVLNIRVLGRNSKYPIPNSLRC